MTSTTFLYALTEPRTRQIRYIGKADNPKGRRREHIASAKRGENWHVSCWIRKLLKSGQRPDVHILCEVSQDDFERFERAFIALGRQYGFRLTNGTNGGEGASGRVVSSQTRAKLRIAGTGRKLTLQARAKLTAANKGKVASAETLVKMSAVQKGKKASPETRAKMSASFFNKKSPRNTSGFVGVRFRSKGKWEKWEATFQLTGKITHAGYFSKIEDAVFAHSLSIANL